MRYASDGFSRYLTALERDFSLGKKVVYIVPDSILMIMVLVGASIVGSLIMLFAFRGSRKKRQAVYQFANENGWRIATQSDSERYSHQSIDTTLLCNDKENWILGIYVSTSAATVETSSSVKRWVEWHTPLGALAEGIAVLGPPLPEKTVKMLNKPMTSVFSNIIKGLMFQYSEGMGVELSECVLVEETAGDENGAVLATTGQEQAVDMFKGMPALMTLRDGKNHMQQAVVTRNTEGIHLRVRNVVFDTDVIQQLVEAGKAIQEKLVVTN